MANENCIICDLPFPTDSKGCFVGRRHILAWGAPIHSNCVWGNHDGIVPTDALLARLSVRGIEPIFNEHGWITVPAVS